MVLEVTKENYDLLKAQKLTRAKIAERFGIPEWKLKKTIAANGWGRKVPTYQYNGCFSTVNKESAYWAGFLFADGCVDTKHRLRLMLQASDINHIKKFRDFVGAGAYQIQECSGYSRKALEFTSQALCIDLKKFGIVPNKTKLGVVPSIDFLGEFLPDFLRGLFDGDGTICESFSNKNSITATLYTGFAISKLNMDWLSEVLLTKVGVQYKSYEKNSIFTITLNTNKSKCLLHYMYDDCAENIRLDRKYEMFVDIVLLGNRKTREL